MPRLHVVFLECWDAANLDSADHRSHVSYPAGGACPSSHPRPIPRLGLQVDYPPGEDVTGAVFSSGGQYSAHADWINAWRGGEGGMADLVRRCLTAGVHCSPAAPRA